MHDKILSLTGETIVFDTNILICALADSGNFLPEYWHEFIDMLNTLLKNNEIFFTDITIYEYKKHLKKIDSMGKKRISKHRIDVFNKLIGNFYKKDRVLLTDSKKIEENLLKLDQEINFEDIKYQDKIILLNSLYYFGTNFYLLTSDHGDFINKIPNQKIEKIYCSSFLKKDYSKPHNVYIIKYKKLFE